MKNKFKSILTKLKERLNKKTIDEPEDMLYNYESKRAKLKD